MDVSELLAPETAYTALSYASAIFLIACIAACAWAYRLLPEPSRKTRIARVGSAVATGVMVIASIAIFQAQDNHAHREQVAYEAALFDRYGLSEQFWGEDSKMPTWKQIQSAGDTGVVTAGAYTFDSNGTVKIALDGTVLKVTLPGGEEYPLAGGDSGE